MDPKQTTAGSASVSAIAGVLAGIAANYITTRFGVPVSPDWLIGLAGVVTGAVHYFTHKS